MSDLPPSTCKEPGRPYFSRLTGRSEVFMDKKPCKTKKGWQNRLKRWMQRQADCASIRWHRNEFGTTPQ